MQSFRTELEDPVVERDIIELERKIRLHKEGKIDDEKFRSLRLARGVYGQRQEGVQMIRIKIPYGKASTKQLLKIADVSDKYSTGVLHVTTRQDIQIHYVSLDRTPELWSELEQSDITLREACGNTVRNITASHFAGIDPEEAFDVSPYAHALFEYFLRNPICQEMGRKIKIAFSSSEKDLAYTWIHDLGFIPKLKGSVKGFKVIIGGGLGAQPHVAINIYDFLPADKIIPFTEAVLRVFDRYGERNRRAKARLKFLIQSIGIEQFLQLVTEEEIGLAASSFHIDDPLPEVVPAPYFIPDKVEIEDTNAYDTWLRTNVFEQSQKGFFAIGIRLPLGNIDTDTVRKLIPVIKKYTADEVRFTIGQNILLKFVRPEAIEGLYLELHKLNLALPGFETTQDVTSCPGTDTCNLGISNSTNVALELQRVIREEYESLVENREIKIKISGCMNSCGQHGLAHIGFHGSSIKVDGQVAPALQILLGGGSVGNGSGRIAEKVIKIPSKRAPEALRLVLDNFATSGYEVFNEYYDEKGKIYFYDLLKPLAETTDLPEDFFQDWGQSTDYKKEIGVGECAGVVVDLVATLLYDAEEKFENAIRLKDEGRTADALYETYNGIVATAKALLLDKNVRVNSHHELINAFDEAFPEEFGFKNGFKHFVLQIKSRKPSLAFLHSYQSEGQKFISKAKQLRPIS